MFAILFLRPLGLLMTVLLLTLMTIVALAVWPLAVARAALWARARHAGRLWRSGSILGLALCVAACASTSNLTPALIATRDFTVAEQSFDAAVKAADIVVNTGALPPATVTKIKTLADAGYADVKIARTAIAAADAPTLASVTLALQALATQIAALAPAKP